MKNIFTLLILGFSFFANGQQVCNQTVVYFDSDQFNLEENEKQKIDSLLQISGEELLIELYGHTDSVNDLEYNIQLSQNRVKSVLTYIQKKSDKKMSFKSLYFGENEPTVPNNSDQNMALNRRVEINFIPLENGQIVFNGSKGEQAKIDTSYFKDCKICNLKPKFDSYSTEEAANAAGIDLITTDGRELITGGMMSFKFEDNECIKEKDDCCVPVTISMSSNTMDTSMTAWTLDENGRWYEDIKDTILLGSLDECKINTSLCLFCRNSSCCGFLNCDVCKSKCSLLINKEFNEWKSKLNYDNYVISNNEVNAIATISLPECLYSLYEVRFVGEIDEDYYYLKLDSNQIKSLKLRDDSFPCRNFYIVDTNLLNIINFSDTIIKLKIKGVKEPSKVGYYNQDYEHFVKIEQIKKRKFQSNYLDFPHQMTFSEGRDKSYYFDYDDVKTKYRKKKKKLKVKIKKKHIKQYTETHHNKK